MSGRHDLDGTAASPARDVSARLFGGIQVFVGGVRVVPVESARVRSLLAFLILHRDAPHPRQRLAFMLWPESSEAQARTNLRHLLHTLRQAMPEMEAILDITPATIAWRDDMVDWLDVAAFDAAEHDAGVPGVSITDEVASLRQAIDLYRGDLLDGMYDDWVLDLRDKFRDRYLIQLRRLAGLLEASGDRGEAVRLGRELLRCDPLREETYRFLMQTLAAAGDRSGAARLYHECVATMEKELRVSPSTETVSAYETLIADLTAGGTMVERGAVTADRPMPLVGRARQWQRLTESWVRAEKGGAHLVVVTGEAGVGKTRLVEELAGWCARRGAAVASGRSYSTEGELGFDVAISWLRSGAIAAGLLQGWPADVAMLSRLLPELQRHAPNPKTNLDSTELRRRTFEAITHALAAPNRATLLIVDDAQWCDEPTLQLIHFMLRADDAMRVLVVATVRREELDQSHPLTAVIGGLQHIERMVEVDLDRLSRAESAELLQSLQPDALDRTASDLMFEQTDGNPLFIVESVRAGWHPNDIRTRSITPKLQAVIATRLRSVSIRSRPLLEMAATVGRQFTPRLLGAALGADDGSVATAVDELWRRGLIREHALEAYDFSHGMIRDAAYAAQGRATVRNNHRLIAESLARLHTGDSDPTSGEIARHFERAAQPDEAVAWYQRAAFFARRLDANVEATQMFERALALLDARPDSTDRSVTQLRVLSALSIPLAITGGFASERLTEVQRTARRLADELAVDVEPSLLRSVAMSNLCTRDFSAARAVSQQLRDLAAARGDRPLMVESEYLMGIGAFWDGSFGDARRHFEVVVEEFDPATRSEHLMRFGHEPRIVCLSRLANTLWFIGLDDLARHACDDAVTAARDLGHPNSRSVTLVFASLLAIDRGETSRYRDFVEELSVERDNEPIAIALDAFAGYRDVLEGDITGGISRIRRAVDIGPPDHAPGQQATFFRLLVAAAERVLDATSGLAMVDDALASTGTRIWEPEHRRVRAQLLVNAGRPHTEAMAELDVADALASRFGAAGLSERIERTRALLAFHD